MLSQCLFGGLCNSDHIKQRKPGMRVKVVWSDEHRPRSKGAGRGTFVLAKKGGIFKFGLKDTLPVPLYPYQKP